MKTLKIDPFGVDDGVVKDIASFLLKGEIVALPTDTVYGLAARADNKEAVERLYEIKQRQRNKPFTVAFSCREDALNYLSTLPPFAYRLTEKYWPGPLTLVYYCRNLSEEKRGVRVPNYPFLQKLLEEVGLPVYLTSANKANEIEVTTAEELEKIFKDEINFIVDAGDCRQRPSSVVDITYHPFKILREGQVRENDVIETFVRKRIVFVCTGNTCRSPLAEFLLKKYLTLKKPYLEGRYEIFSAGIISVEGGFISSKVLEILKHKENIDIFNFFSQRLKKEMILSSDIIFTMEKAHSDYILNSEPSCEGRVFVLSKFLPGEEEKDIPDPIGASDEVYQEVYRLIKEAVLEIIEWL